LINITDLSSYVNRLPQMTIAINTLVTTISLYGTEKAAQKIT